MRKTRAAAPVLMFGLLLSATVLRSEEAGQASSTRPPKNLKKVGDHWTPWDPPAPGPNDYIIERGDTLWDLSGKWLGNPFLWPQIWDQNRYILDSHWIYPGDPLVVPSKPTVVPPEGPPPGEEEKPPPPAEEAPRPKPPAPPAPPPLLAVADPADLYCSGYIEPSHSPAGLWVVAGELEKAAQGQGDVVYLSQGRSQGVEPGAEYAVERVAGRVLHPATGEVLGAYVRRLGRARVLVAQDDRSIAVLELACEDIRAGDELVAWSEIPVPMIPPMGAFDRYDVTPSGGPQGYVVELRDRLSAVGAGYVIHTDLGSGTVEPGEVLTLYRDNGDLPRAMLGRAVVLTVEEGTSTAKIVQAVREVEKGDRVEK